MATASLFGCKNVKYDQSRFSLFFISQSVA